MDRRLLIPTLTLALVSTALAGCIDLPAAESTRTEVGALEVIDVADGAALAWAPDAQLVSIFGLEILHDADPLPVDENPGNGLAPAWIFAYAAGDGLSAAFRVLADGTVVKENDTMGAEAYDDLAEPLGPLNFDSPDALKIAAVDASFAKALSGVPVTLAEGVAAWDGRTAWWFAAMSPEGSAYAAVDAATGELLDAKTFQMPQADALRSASYRPSVPVRIEDDGTLTRQEPTAEIPFVLEGLDGEGRLDIAIQRTLGADGLSWEILDEDGDTVASGYIGRMLASNSEKRSFSIELDDPGAYTLVLELRQPTPTPVTSGAVGYALKLAIGGLEHEEEEH